MTYYYTIIEYMMLYLHHDDGYYHDDIIGAKEWRNHTVPKLFQILYAQKFKDSHKEK